MKFNQITLILVSSAFLSACSLLPQSPFGKTTINVEFITCFNGSKVNCLNSLADRDGVRGADQLRVYFEREGANCRSYNSKKSVCVLEYEMRGLEAFGPTKTARYRADIELTKTVDGVNHIRID